MVKPLKIIGKEKTRAKRATGGGGRILENAPYIFTKLSPAKETYVYDTYWNFAAERQRIFFNKIRGEIQPWTKDEILMNYKFTNAYRASDRVSQFLIKTIIYSGETSLEEVFFRIILFKIFNKIETWELLSSAFGEITYREFSFKSYDAVLTKAIDSGQRIYSAAYIMPTGGPGSDFGRKHRMHLKLIENMMANNLPSLVCAAKNMRQVFDLLKSYPSIGDFLAFQFATDLNYSPITNFSEMEFVVPGPGAKDGLKKCFSDFGGLNEAELIKLVTDRQGVEFERLGISFDTLWGRKLQLVDCQNLFCEVDKYARVKHPEVTGLTGRSRIKQKYRPKNSVLTYWYPPKWGINEKIGRIK